jgi:hypothetical protein
MKKLRRSFIFLLVCNILFLVEACRLPASPEKYFDVTALNANSVSYFGSEYFTKMLGYRGKPLAAGPGVDQYNYEQQLGFAIKRVEKYLKNIDELLPTKDTQALIDASKDLFQFTLESYKKDHLPIAKMIDRKAPADEITKAMNDLDKRLYMAFSVRYNKLYEIGTQYAKDNNIKLMEMPQFNK